MRGPSLTRRQFMTGSVSLVALSVLGGAEWWRAKRAPVTGRILGASSDRGHKLRSGGLPAPTREERRKIVIVGGGIAGLSAAWKLQRSGIADFTLLELEKAVGGNAHSGENAVSAYPWGAHYVPLLTREATAAHALFRDLGVITGEENGAPIYNEYYVSAEPHERLFLHGRWQEGMVPQIGASDPDRAQYQRFFAETDRLKDALGRDGKRLFAIPLDKSSEDPEWRALDAISMQAYLAKNGFDSAYLRWYVDYCCRDDFGASCADVSAWAGLHYFAARNGRAANADAGSVITWPEGNGWLVNRLTMKLAGHLTPDMLAYRVTKTADGVTVLAWDADRKVTTAFHADAVILAVPRFVAERLFATGTEVGAFAYSPWMVANVTLDALPEGRGAPLSWDNMIYDSPLLGYVTATHQHLALSSPRTVLTYYWPLSHLPPKPAREAMFKRPYEAWRDLVLDELLRVHPELEGKVAGLDVWLWGHGMIRPSPGFLWGAARAAANRPTPPIFHAHSDMSGISIFEEANDRGVRAAENAMRHLAYPFETSL